MRVIDWTAAAMILSALAITGLARVTFWATRSANRANELKRHNAQEGDARGSFFSHRDSGFPTGRELRISADGTFANFSTEAKVAPRGIYPLS